MRANSVAAELINREPVEVAVGDLDEDVCPVDDVCEHPALGQSLGHATFQRLVHSRSRASLSRSAASAALR